jgi:hypothetical protein
VRHDHVILGTRDTIRLKSGWKLSYTEKSEFESPDFDGCMRDVEYIDENEFGYNVSYYGYLDYERIDAPYIFILSEKVLNGYMIRKTLDLETLDSKDVSIFNCDINGVSNK